MVRGENEMATEVHCDDGNILNKGWSRSKVGIFGFSRGKEDWGNIDASCIGDIPIGMQHLATQWKYDLRFAVSILLVFYKVC